MTHSLRCLLSITSCMILTMGCLPAYHEEILHDQSGVQVGIETDLSANERSMPSVLNKHPALYPVDDLRVLLGSLEVSAWSGAVLGLVLMPTPKPVFTEEEVAALVAPLASALKTAGQRERVFFKLKNPAAPYNLDRTAGSLFFRDEYLHVILTDHYAFFRADTGGGETYDPRDAKGMKLWLARPARAASVPASKEPLWNTFETVHISLIPSEVLSARKAQPPPVAPMTGEAPAGTSGQSVTPAPAKTSGGVSSDDTLKSQMRELTDSNQDLQGKLKDQAAELEKLKTELKQLKDSSKTGKGKPALGGSTPSGQSPQ